MELIIAFALFISLVISWFVLPGTKPVAMIETKAGGNVTLQQTA